MPSANVPNRMSAGDLESPSPLTALATTKPKFSTRDQNPRPDHPERLDQAEDKRAAATRNQYTAESAMDAQKMILAWPYTEPRAPGSRGVVAMSMQSNSLLNGSTARSRVCRVASSRLVLRGAYEEKAKGPAGMGQYNPEVLSGAGRGDGGRNVVQKNELLLRISIVNTSVVENSVAKGRWLNTSRGRGGRKASSTHPSQSSHWRFPG